MTTPNLTLIGTNHRDPQGMQRLTNALSSIQPKWITMETAPGLRGFFKLEELAGLGLRLQDITPKLSPEQIQRVIEGVFTQGYEERVALLYTDKRKTPYAAVDPKNYNPVYDTRLVHRSSEYPKQYDTSKHITEEDLDVMVACREAGIEDPLLSCIILGLTPFNSTNAYTNSGDITEGHIIRDQDMEKGIRAMIKQHGPNGVHISGNGHLFGCYGESPNLYQRLADLNPTRVKLCEFD